MTGEKSIRASQGRRIIVRETKKAQERTEEKGVHQARMTALAY
jgi:hypothetical protein